MNTNTASMPISSARTPLSMFSWPRLGPMARSSTTSTGAASEPERSSRQVPRLADRQSGDLELRPKHAADRRHVDDGLGGDVPLDFLTGHFDLVPALLN